MALRAIHAARIAMMNCGYEPTAALGLDGAFRRHVEDHQVQLWQEARGTPQTEVAAFNGVSAGTPRDREKEVAAVA